MAVATLDRRQSRELDRRAIEEYGIAGIVLMENAGRGVADVIERLEAGGPIVVCCGKGNNAGDGFVIARHLDIRRYDVRVVLWAEPADLSGDAAANYAILAKTGVPIHRGPNEPAAAARLFAGADWIVDALLGTGAQGEPRPPFDAAIDAINASGAVVVAVDLPSGLDCDTGRAAAHTVRAAHTCTFNAPKPGFLAPHAGQYIGRVHVLDIGAPRRLLEAMLEPAATT